LLRKTQFNRQQLLIHLYRDNGNLVDFDSADSSGYNLNLLQVGDEKADHNILDIIQTLLVPYCQKLFPGKWVY
jgi:hypothetical protein